MPAMFRADVRAANRNVTNRRQAATSAVPGGISGGPAQRRLQPHAFVVTNSGFGVMNDGTLLPAGHGRLDPHGHCL
jgi:hypothetical protein